jgi:ubiquinone/menaquinone biosynthesis C-methylase UbiE
MVGERTLSRDFFNENARGWDILRSEKDGKKMAALAACLGLQPGMMVLDVGSGTGVFLPYLMAAMRGKGYVIALDFAENMLRESQEKQSREAAGYLCGDVMALPLKSASCDIVVCYSSFPHFPDKLQALKEMMRVVKPRGNVFVCHTSGREQINAIHRKVNVLQHDLLPDAIEMQQLYQAAGFTEIAVQDKTDSYFAVGRKQAEG